MTGVQLGLRYVMGARGGAALRFGARVCGFALAVFLLWVVMALVQAQASRQKRLDATEPAVSTSTSSKFRFTESVLPFDNQPWTMRLVSGTSPAPPAPPGLSSFPEPGDSYISPALGEEVARNPSAARRVPGRVVGLIGDAGLAYPGQLLSISGVSLSSAGAADLVAASGWGSSATPREDAVLPWSGVVIVAATLTAPALLIFIWVVSMLGASERKRRDAALFMIGVSGGALIRAARVETAVTAAAGAAVGLALGLVAVARLAESGGLGISWYPTGGVGTWVLAGAIAVGLCWGAARLAGRSTRVGLRSPMVSPAASPAPPALRHARVAVALFVASLGVLLAMIAVGWLSPNTPLNSGPMALMFVASVATATLGAVLTLDPALAWLGNKMASGTQSPQTLIAGRRLSADSPRLARSTSAITVTMITLGMSWAVITDLASLVQPEGQPVWLSVTFPTHATSAAQRRRAIPAQSTSIAIQPTASGSASGGAQQSMMAVGSCLALAGLGTPISGCLDDHSYRQSHTGGNQTSASGLPDGGTFTPRPGSLLADADYVLTQPANSIAGSPRPGAVFVLAPAAGQTPQDLASAVLHAAPTASLVYTNTDIANLYRLPLARHLVLTFSGIGLIAAVACLLVATADGARRRRRDRATLAVLGAPRRTEVGTQILQTAVASAGASSLGWVTGVVGATAYLSLAGHRAITSGIGVAAVLLTSAVLVAGILTIIGPLTTPQRVATEDLRRE